MTKHKPPTMPSCPNRSCPDSSYDATETQKQMSILKMSYQSQGLQRIVTGKFPHEVFDQV